MEIKSIGIRSRIEWHGTKDIRYFYIRAPDF